MANQEHIRPTEELDAATALILLSYSREVVDGDEYAIVKSPVISSDGIATTLPAGFLLQSDTRYRQRLAQGWMQHTKRAIPGVKYILDQLPEHYFCAKKAVMEPEPGRPMRRDGHCWLYGSSMKKGWQSPNDYWPHFLWLSTGCERSCECRHCKPKANEK